MWVAIVLVFVVVLMVLFGCRRSILVAVVVALAVVLVVLLYDVLAPD